MTATISANTSKRRRVRTAGRCRPTRQTELFGDDRPGTLVNAPVWHLPAATQALLTSLMVRLLLDHAKTRRAGPMAEAGHDF